MDWNCCSSLVFQSVSENGAEKTECEFCLVGRVWCPVSVWVLRRMFESLRDRERENRKCFCSNFTLGPRVYVYGTEGRALCFALFFQNVIRYELVTTGYAKLCTVCGSK